MLSILSTTGCALGIGKFVPGASGLITTRTTSETNEKGESAGAGKVWARYGQSETNGGGLLGVRLGPSMLSLDQERGGVSYGTQLHLDGMLCNSRRCWGLGLGYGNSSSGLAAAEVKYGGFSAMPFYTLGLGDALSLNLGLGLDYASLSTYKPGASDSSDDNDHTLGGRAQVALTFMGEDYGARLELTAHRSGLQRLFGQETHVTGFLLTLEPIFGF